MPKRGLDLKYCDYNATEEEDSKGGFLTVAETKKLRTADYQPSHLEKCECGSIDLDYTYLEHYDLRVCISCKRLDKYQLLTKTECKQDYLLTEPEMKELKSWMRPNPHKQSYSNMLLYCRSQVEAFAIKKWHSLEEMDQEFEKREQKKQQKKQQKFQTKLKELRTKTRTVLFKEDHEHAYVDEADCMVCKTCGFRVEFETL
ncbi:DNA binding domain-containing protein [Gorgonomyces haynaldii]|nr:DNA binding domain-containing protein [Gorgonomyces haynaldii]